MKRILLWSGIILVVLIVAAVLAVSFFLDGAVKSGVELVGSKVTRVDVTLNKVNLSLWSGSGTIQGLVVGNPRGYQTSNAVSVGSATLSLQPGSLLSDKIVIRKIEVIAPEITFEGGLSGNNLSTIMANLNETTGGAETNAPPKAETGKEKEGKKLEVDDFLISGAKVHVSLTGMGGRTLTVGIDDIHLKDLGTGPEGISSADLSRRVWKELEKEAVKAAEKAIAEFRQEATTLIRDFSKSGGGTNVSGDTSNTVNSIRNLLKKK